MTIGQRLKELRNGLSQRAVAQAVGIKQQVWNRYEKDETAPASDSIIKICNYFNCSADELLGLTTRGGSATANGNGAIAAAGSNIHIEVGKDDKPGEMKVCAKCPKVAALQTTLATILQTAKSGAAKVTRKKI